MHFDEVYHARTATEFLQDWRYGDESRHLRVDPSAPRQVPIAAGIVAFGDDRVSATGSLGAPVNDALVEPRHDGHRNRRPDGRTAVARDGHGNTRLRPRLARRGRAIDLGPTGALAHDPTASQLFAATEAGELYTLDLAQLDIGGPESVEPFQVADLGVPVDRLAVAEDGTTVLATAGDRLLVVDSVTGEVTLDTERPGLVEAADVGSGSAVVASPASIDDPPRSPRGWPSCSAGTQQSSKRNSRPGRSASRSAGSATASRRASRTRSRRVSCRASRSSPVEQVLVADGDGVAFLDRATGDELGRSRWRVAPTALPRSPTSTTRSTTRRRAPRTSRRTPSSTSGRTPRTRARASPTRTRCRASAAVSAMTSRRVRCTSSAERRTGPDPRSTSSNRTRTPCTPTRACRSTLRRGPSTSTRGVRAAIASSSSRSLPTGVGRRSRSVSTRSAGGCPG